MLPANLSELSIQEAVTPDWMCFILLQRRVDNSLPKRVGY
jgi:hypothetical protein